MLVACSQIGLIGKRSVSKTLIWAVCLCLWGGLQAMAAESPQTVVQTGTDQILKILKQYPQESAARREQIRAVLDGYFDFPAIARLALGPQWKSLPPEKQQEFTQEFIKLLFNTYIGDIEQYARQKVTYSVRSIYEGYVVVEAHAEDSGGPVTLDYYLHLTNGSWKVYDIAVEGVSLVTNYRSQFEPVLVNRSFDYLLMTLRQKIAQICGMNRC